MRYGYFDDPAREYVIIDPRTPMPWANYLGSPEYGAIVTQNAGGYSFVRSGAAGRTCRRLRDRVHSRAARRRAGCRSGTRR